ncbi:MAG: hypothetical protein LPK45_07035 [Bacteroidota bacterium]|nr:hypothetical protein [Bacteroidota bacterium]MDX5430830.1 hypothetical protein [Bacteroidota bacterium]MDX5469574.1 hypothetical protein [Bacteroidota bacterium]
MVYPEISRFLESLSLSEPHEERDAKWQNLAAKISADDFSGAVDFICTHNARRSAISQSLFAALAHEHSFDKLISWSGGAEVTFIHPNTIAALQRIGFRLSEKQGEENPVYFLRFSDEQDALRLFSKKFDDETTPGPYHAVLVCSKGDAACPFIPMVKTRNLIPFEDPGYADGTPEADQAYDQAVKEIGSDLKKFFSYLTALR